MLPILKDRRYIRIGDKPVLLVYRVDLLQRPVETAQTWRTLAAANGLPTCICVRSSRLGFRIRDSYGFDAALKFPPHGLALDSVEPQPPGVTLDFAGTIADFRAAARLATAAQAPDYPLHRAVMVRGDNTPRRGKRGIIFANSTARNYCDWLSALVRDSHTRRGASELIFVNAWNEWAEGAHLEPDLKRGHAFEGVSLTAPARSFLLVPRGMRGRHSAAAGTRVLAIVSPAHVIPHQPRRPPSTPRL